MRLASIFLSLFLFGFIPCANANYEELVARLRDEGIYERVRDIFFNTPQLSREQEAMCINRENLDEVRRISEWFSERRADLSFRTLKLERVKSEYASRAFGAKSTPWLAELCKAFPYTDVFRDSNSVAATVAYIRKILGIRVFASWQRPYVNWVRALGNLRYQQPNLMRYVEHLHVVYIAQDFAANGLLFGKKRSLLKPEEIVVRLALGDFYAGVSQDDVLMKQLADMTKSCLQNKEPKNLPELRERLAQAIRIHKNEIFTRPRTAEALKYLERLFSK